MHESTRQMKGAGRNSLLVAGTCSMTAAAIHLACIVGGPEWFRLLGAGEGMAAMAARGHWYPAVVTACIAGILVIWGLYAWSGAGALRRLPLLRTVLCAITAIYLLRGVAFVPLQAYFPGNSPMFWYVSSAICFSIGMVHLVGLVQAWPRLSRGLA